MYRSYLCQKKAFKPVTSKQIGLLELVHSDLADFKNTAGKGGKTYYITFVDDYSRYTKVYLLSLINEAEEMFLYKVEVKNQLDQKIKRFRTDRGGEYETNRLAAFCEKNGIDELKNRTIKEMKNAMLFKFGTL